jgi:hypothetical protein
VGPEYGLPDMAARSLQLYDSLTSQA